MISKKAGYLIALLSILLSCQKEKADTVRPSDAKFSKISIGNGQFHNSEGALFFPWGLNYTNPEGVGLIEDNWHNENTWQTILEDFKEMKRLGANVIRLHLQYHQFMTDANTANTSSLDRLRQLVEFAEKEELYLDITGLAAYRQSVQPEFYISMSDAERWQTQKIFWQQISATIASSPAVFAYNLMNEAVVSVGCDGTTECEWTPGDGFGGFHFVQNITRNPDSPYPTTLQTWISEMTAAIRSEDANTLITIGSLALGPYNQFASDVDFLSPHIYPRSGDIQESIDKVINNISDVPQVIEETSNLNCTIKELEEFVEGIEGSYNGLMGHYFGTPIEDLSSLNIREAVQKNFLEFFRDNKPQ